MPIKPVHTFTIFLLGVFLVGKIHAQESVDQLIDSLANVSTHHQKAALATEISNLLLVEDWERAEHYLNIGEDEAKESREDSVLAKFYFEAGKIYQNKRVHDIALEYFTLAYDYFEHSSDTETKLKIENNLAISYASTDNIETAMTYFRIVYSKLKPQGDSLKLAKVLNNIGNLYFDIQTDSALHYFNHSLVIARELENPEVSLYIYTNLGRIHQKREEFKKAHYYFNLAKTESASLKNEAHRTWVLINTAAYMLEVQLNDSAIYYANMANTLMDENSPSIYREKTNRILYQAYLRNGEYQHAADNFIVYDSIRDEIVETEAKLGDERLKLLRVYKSRIQAQQLKVSKRNFQLMIVGVLVLSILIISFLLFLRYKSHLQRISLLKEIAEGKQRELKVDLELKNKSLTLTAMNEIYKSNAIQDITKELQEAKLIAQKVETRQNIDAIIGRLKNNLDSNPWKEFESHFSEIHESFFQNLTNKHPDLTPKDIRLCALLKMNLTTKEIAKLTGQSFKGIENARTRIRKKLDLTNQKTDISIYLNSF